MIILFQIYCCMCQWTNFENWSYCAIWWLTFFEPLRICLYSKRAYFLCCL